MFRKFLVIRDIEALGDGILVRSAGVEHLKWYLEHPVQDESYGTMVSESPVQISHTVCSSSLSVLGQSIHDFPRRAVTLV
jgi:hypothetical protein